MNVIMSVLKLLIGVLLFLLMLVLLIALFEIPPRLLALMIGPMHPELAQVYTMFEIGIILCILIFASPAGFKWFSRRWDQWMKK